MPDDPIQETIATYDAAAAAFADRTCGLDLEAQLARLAARLGLGARVLDVGCGKGAFTARLKENFPAYRITGVDIAPTAIKKARQEYGHLGIEFITLDVREYQNMADRAGKDFGLVVMSDIMWYVLPEFEKMVRYLDRIIAKGGWLLISQSFCQPEEQKYGSDIVSSPQEMMRLIPYRVVEMIEANRFSNHHAVILYQV